MVVLLFEAISHMAVQALGMSPVWEKRPRWFPAAFTLSHHLGWISGPRERVTGHWHRLPREAVAAPTPTEFRKHLDNTLGDDGIHHIKA